MLIDVMGFHYPPLEYEFSIALLMEHEHSTAYIISYYNSAITKPTRDPMLS